MPIIAFERGFALLRSRSISETSIRIKATMFYEAGKFQFASYQEGSPVHNVSVFVWNL
jgi:hypothetical protein